ncbi:hypothetical protein BS78_07G036000 [Paspalum vaginatum]|nr:hypothetical protein BS78_07G036000 [Paspalum vaginatum]
MRDPLPPPSRPPPPAVRRPAAPAILLPPSHTFPKLGSVSPFLLQVFDGVSPPWASSGRGTSPLGCRASARVDARRSPGKPVSGSTAVADSAAGNGLALKLCDHHRGAPAGAVSRADVPGEVLTATASASASICSLPAPERDRYVSSEDQAFQEKLKIFLSSLYFRNKKMETMSGCCDVMKLLIQKTSRSFGELTPSQPSYGV